MSGLQTDVRQPDTRSGLSVYRVALDFLSFLDVTTSLQGMLGVRLSGLCPFDATGGFGTADTPTPRTCQGATAAEEGLTVKK